MNTSLLFEAIASSIADTPISENSISESELEILYQASKMHDVAHLVGYSLDKTGLLGSGEISSLFKKQIYLAVYRYQTMLHEQNSICNVFEEEGIDHMALKGAIMRDLYPQPWMRTSCDIDILIKKEDLQRAVDALSSKLHYKRGKMNYHDISLFSESGVHLELHFNIRENMKSIDHLLLKVWENSSLTDGTKHRYEQSPEFFVFHNVAHMSYHFTHGGCGIRPFIDFYMIKNKLNFDEQVLRGFLNECGLEKFYESILQLNDVWFGEKDHTNATKLMESYVLPGGVYGSFENGVSAQQEINGGKLRHIIYKMWIPRDVLKVQFPVIEKHKYLTPIMQVARWFKVLFNGRAFMEITCVTKIDKKQSRKTKKMLESIGLIDQK